MEDDGKRIEMSDEELKALPVVMDLVTAGRAFGLGRTKSHELARADEFPCRVLRLGRKYRVTKVDLFRALGLKVDLPVAEDAPRGAA